MIDEEDRPRACFVGGVVGLVPEEREQAVRGCLHILRRVLAREG